MWSKRRGPELRKISRATIGGVPDAARIEKLARRGYRTLVDVRDIQEVGAGLVRSRAEAVGLRYRWIPIPRHGVTGDMLESFYREVFLAEGEPSYSFSGDGMKLIALVTIFEIVAEQDALFSIEPSWIAVGRSLEQDCAFRRELVDLLTSGVVTGIVRDIKDSRPDLCWRSGTLEKPAARTSWFRSASGHLRSMPFVTL